MSARKRVAGAGTAGHWSSTKLTKILTAVLAGLYSPSQGSFTAGDFKSHLVVSESYFSSVCW